MKPIQDAPALLLRRWRRKKVITLSVLRPAFGLVREELEKAQQSPERVPRAVKRFIRSLPSPDPIKTFIQNLSSNRISRS